MFPGYEQHTHNASNNTLILSRLASICFSFFYNDIVFIFCFSDTFEDQFYSGDDQYYVDTAQYFISTDFHSRNNNETTGQ